MKTTSLRARGLACALLAGTALCGLAAEPAAAQTPPAYRNFDSNGVDLVRGDYLLSFVEGSIGSGEAELALVRTAGSAAGGPSHWDGIGLSLTRPYAGGPATVTVTLANKSERFTESGGTFTSSLAIGSTLTGGGGSLTYATSDGTMIGFSDPSGNAQGGTTNFCKNSLQTSCSLVPTAISTPDGRTVTLDWTLNDRCATVFNPDGSLDCEYDWRLAGVANDFGHSIAFAYASGPPGGQPPASWYQRTGASFNAGAASVGYSYPSNGVTDVTDTGGRVWRVSPGTIRRPGATADSTVVATGGTGGTVSSVTRDGLTTNYTRSVSGNVVTMAVTEVDPAGPDPVTTIVSNLALSRPTAVTDPLGKTTSYQYDSAGRLTRVTAPEGNYVQYSLDSRGNVTQSALVPKSGSGATIVTSAVFPSSCSFNIACNQPTSTTDERGQVTDYDWDATYGVLESVTLPAPGAVRPQTRFAYTLDPASGRYQLTGVSQCRTGSAPACVGTSDETRVTIAYNADGSVDSTTMRDGTGAAATTATVALDYDAVGNLVRVDGPLSGTADTVHYRYDGARQLVGTVSPDPDGGGPLKPRAVRNSYSNGLLTKVEQGNVDSASDAHWAAFAPALAVETGYDANARPVTARLVSGSTVHAFAQTGYDALGRVDCVVQRMDPNDFASSLPGACTRTSPDGAHGPDRIVKTAYDLAGRAVGVTDAFGTADASTTTATYSDNGLVATVTDGEGNKTTFDYDGHDRLEKTRFPDLTQGAGTSSTADYEESTYESLAGGTRTSNLVAAFRNRAVETIAFTYDALGRLTFKNLPGSELDVTYGYDLLGQLTSASHSGGSLTFAWDALGRQISQTGASGTYSSAYDLAGRRTRLTHPDGFFVQQDYLVTGEMVKIRENGAASGVGVLATYEYDQLGRRDRLVLGNGAVTDYQYDAASRLWKLTHDPAGTGHDNIVTLTYNPAGQIVGRVATNNSYAWTGHGSGTTDYATDGLNRLPSQTTGGATTTFSHDPRSNRASDGSRTYVFDSENKSRGTATAPWHYDPLGRLSGVSTSPGTPPAIAYESYVDNLVAERTPGSSSVQRRHVFGPGVDEPLVWYEGSGTTDRRFLQADERDSIVAVSNGSAAVQNVNTYDEYGRTQVSNNSWQARFAYTGQRYFGGFGLYHYKSRMYDPKAGRFLQPDPIGYGGGMNMYAYVGGDPVNFTDPMGLQDQSIVVWGYGPGGLRGGGDVFGQGGSTGISEAELQRRIEEMNKVPNDDINGDGEPDPDIIITGHCNLVCKVVRFFAGGSSSKRRGGSGDGRFTGGGGGSFGGGGATGHFDWPDPCGCLESGTLVVTPNGAVPIEQIEIGDLVLAFNETTNEVAPKRVTDLIRPSPKSLYALQLLDSGGELETFHATDDHPWKVKRRGWVDTLDLAEGDRIVTASGSDMAVVSVTRTDRIEQTYNLTVADWHTFIVGEDGAVVHNDCKLFAKAGIPTTSHFDNRVARREPRGITPQKALDAYRNGRLYYNPATGRFIRHSSRTGVSVVTDAPSRGMAITVFEGKPSPTWNPVPWRPGQ